jgi:TonB family protein
MDKDFQNLDSKRNAEYFKIISPTPDKNAEFLRTTYLLDGTKQAEQSYDLKGEVKVYNGMHKHYYESGELFYQLEFKNGKKHGNLIAYWKNGRKRRHDVFKRDKLKQGKVWNSQGEEINYFKHYIPASFPGGEENLYAFLKEHIYIPQEQKQGIAVKVTLIFTINTEGYLSEIQIVEGAPHRYNAEAVRVVSNMPKWKPTRHFGKAMATRYTLPIIFQK